MTTPRAPRKTPAPRSKARATERARRTRVLRTAALVAAWSSEDQARRTLFVERVYELAGSLPPGAGLRIVLAATSGCELELCFHLIGSDETTFDSLANLLDEPDSPVQTMVATNRPPDRPEVVEELVVRQPLFSADTARQRPILPTYDPGQEIRGLCAALLEDGAARFAVEITPVERTAKAEDLARQLSPDSMTPLSLADTLRQHGTFLRADVRLSSSRPIPSRLRAELHGLATPIDVVDATRLERRSNGQRPHPNGETGATAPVLLGVRSLAALFRLPVAFEASFPGFDVVPAPYVRAPLTVTRRAPEETEVSHRLGTAHDSVRNVVSVGLAEPDFARHVYVPGQTGAGKSTMLRAIACAVAERGNGLLFLDPHGDGAPQLLRELPRQRRKDVVFVDAADLDNPAPMNPFAVSDELQRDTALANVTDMFQDLFDPGQLGIVGPRWETWFRMAMLTLLEARGMTASLLDSPSLFLDKKLLESMRPSFRTVDYLVDFWDREMEQTSDFHRSEVLGWFTSKFTAFRTNAVLRAVLGSGEDALDPLSVMNEGRIVVVSLAKGKIGRPVAQMLGYIYLSRYWTAALKRNPDSPPFAMFVDEAQIFSKGALPDILAEGRKFGLSCVLANQYLDQLPESLQHALQGNVGTVIAFRLGDRDVDQLAGRLGPEFSGDALRRLPTLQAACSLLRGGAVQPAFTLDVDHITRVRDMRSKGEMRRQQTQIETASRRFLRAAKAEQRRRRGSPPPPRPGGGPPVHGPPPMAESLSSDGALRPAAVDGALANQPHPSFVDALRAKLARHRSQNGDTGGRHVQT